MIAAWGMEKIFRENVKAVVIVCTFISLIYFGAKKDVLSLDFSPGTKTFVKEIKEIAGKKPVYLYGISDPAMKFYLNDAGII